MESIDYNVILQDYLEEVSRLRTEFVKTYSKVKENSQDVEKLKNRLELRENTLNKYYDTNGYEQSNPQELQQMGKVEREFRTALTRCEDNQNKLKQLKSLFELRLKVMDQEALTWDPALKTADPAVPDASAADNTNVKTHSSAGEKRKLSQAHISPSIASASRSRINSTGRMPKRGSRTSQFRESRLGLSGASDRMKNGSVGLEGDESEDDDKIYCFCRRESFGDMIGCDGENCLYEWFHCECVGMSEPPIGQWYCPSCTQSLMNKND